MWSELTCIGTLRTRQNTDIPAGETVEESSLHALIYTNDTDYAHAVVAALYAASIRAGGSAERAAMNRNRIACQLTACLT